MKKNDNSGRAGEEKFCPVCGAPENALILIKNDGASSYYECENCGETVRLPE